MQFPSSKLATLAALLAVTCAIPSCAVVVNPAISKVIANNPDAKVASPRGIVAQLRNDIFPNLKDSEFQDRNAKAKRHTVVQDGSSTGNCISQHNKEEAVGASILENFDNDLDGAASNPVRPANEMLHKSNGKASGRSNPVLPGSNIDGELDPNNDMTSTPTPIRSTALLDHLTGLDSKEKHSKRDMKGVIGDGEESIAELSGTQISQGDFEDQNIMADPETDGLEEIYSF